MKSFSDTALPHWDTTVVYPSLASPEFDAGFCAVLQTLDELVTLFDQYGINAQAAVTVDAATAQTFETVAARYNDALDQQFQMFAYLSCFVSTNSRDELAQAKQSELRQQLVRMNMLGTRFTAWLGALEVEALMARSAYAREHAYMLRRAKIQAMHLLSPAEETLAAELSVTGSSSWAKLYSTFTSQLLVPIELEGKAQALPMSAIRNLASDANRETRRRAYEAELSAWQKSAVPIAAALNSLKGEMNTLSKRRQWDSPLDVALFINSIDRETLDAMMQAARESFPKFRRYLRAKAKALAVPALAWYDLFAPASSEGRAWSYHDAEQFILKHFGAYSAKLCGLAERAFNENWIDAEPRDGKGGGAFCMRLRGAESRVLTNYKPSFNAVSTLAHELGHAYHNLKLAPRTMLQRATPMTLAETASTFCETIIKNAALQDADAAEQCLIVEASLQGSCQVILDITSRFLFEQRVFDKRRQRDLSVEELNALMLDAQRQTYGDGLDENVLHPYMWAAKSHYYGATFYNFPYMFGLLFGLGLYARSRQDAEVFKAGYDDLLSSTGMGHAAELAARFGIDIRSADFWRDSLNVIGADIDRFEQLVNQAR
jgi:pepF/M3 family oligoendopeptidase